MLMWARMLVSVRYEGVDRGVSLRHGLRCSISNRLETPGEKFLSIYLQGRYI